MNGRITHRFSGRNLNAILSMGGSGDSNTQRPPHRLEQHSQPALPAQPAQRATAVRVLANRNPPRPPPPPLPRSCSSAELVDSRRAHCGGPAVRALRRRVEALSGLGGGAGVVGELGQMFDLPRWVAAYERGLRAAANAAIATAAAAGGSGRRRRDTAFGGGERRLPHLAVASEARAG